MRKLPIGLLVLFLVGCKDELKFNMANIVPYTIQMNDERVVIIDNDNKMISFFTKNGLLINKIDLNTMESQKTDLTLKLNSQIHDWDDTISIKVELIGDKLYWYSWTSGANTRNANNLGLSSSNGMAIYLCGSSCNWVGVYDNIIQKTTYYSTSGVVNNVTLEEFSNIKYLDFRAQTRR